MNASNKVNAKTVFFWNITGSVCNALVSMLLLSVVTRTTNAVNADIFSIGYALAQQFITIGMFQVRNYQATDVKEKFVFSEYFSFRVFTGFVMILVSLGYVCSKGYSFEKASIIFIICLTKVIEALADVYHGFFQQKERLDISGKALALRSVVTFSVFTIAMVFLRNMSAALVCMLISSGVCYWFFEKRKQKDFDIPALCKGGWKISVQAWPILIRQCLPLFINGYLVMALYNIPKNAIDTMSEHAKSWQGIQTDYGIIFMPAFVINLFLIFLRPYMTRMAYAWVQEEKRLFHRLLFQILAGVSVFGIVTVAGAYLLGIPILEFIYGRELSNCKLALILIIVGGGFNSIATVFDNTITVIRQQHLLVLSYAAVWAIAKIMIRSWLLKYKITGAAMTFLFAMVLLTVFNILIFLYGLKKERKRKRRRE